MVRPARSRGAARPGLAVLAVLLATLARSRGSDAGVGRGGDATAGGALRSVAVQGDWNRSTAAPRAAPAAGGPAAGPAAGELFIVEGAWSGAAVERRADRRLDGPPGAVELDGCATAPVADAPVLFQAEVGDAWLRAVGGGDGGTTPPSVQLPASADLSRLVDGALNDVAAPAQLVIDVAVPRVTYKLDRVVIMDASGSTLVDTELAVASQTQFTEDGDTAVNRLVVELPSVNRAGETLSWSSASSIALRHAGSVEMNDMSPEQRVAARWEVRRALLRAGCKACSFSSPFGFDGAAASLGLALMQSDTGSTTSIPSSGTHVVEIIDEGTQGSDLSLVVDPTCHCISAPTAALAVDVFAETGSVTVLGVRVRSAAGAVLLDIDGDSLPAEVSVGSWSSLWLRLGSGSNTYAGAPSDWHDVSLELEVQASGSTDLRTRRAALHARSDGQQPAALAVALLSTHASIAKTSVDAATLALPDGGDLQTTWTDISGLGLSNGCIMGASACAGLALQLRLSYSTSAAQCPVSTVRLVAANEVVVLEAEIPFHFATEDESYPVTVQIDASDAWVDDGSAELSSIEILEFEFGASCAELVDADATVQVHSVLLGDGQAAVLESLDTRAEECQFGSTEASPFRHPADYAFWECDHCCCFVANPQDPSGPQVCLDHGDTVLRRWPTGSVNDACQACNADSNGQILSPLTSFYDASVEVPCTGNPMCTYDDRCTDEGFCVSTPYDTCLMAAFNDEDPSKDCEMCDNTGPFSDTGGCVAKPGHFVVVDEDTSERVCACEIDGVVYAHETPNPLAPGCQMCDVTVSRTAWSAAPDGVQCDPLGEIGWLNSIEQACSYQHVCDAGECVGTGYTCPQQPACGYHSDEWPRQCDLSGPISETAGCRPAIRDSDYVCKPAVNDCQREVKCTGSLATCPGYEQLPGIIYEDAGKAVTALFEDGVELDAEFAAIRDKDAVMAEFDNWRVECDELLVQWAVIHDGECDVARVSSTVGNGWGVAPFPSKGRVMLHSQPEALTWVADSKELEPLNSESILLAAGSVRPLLDDACQCLRGARLHLRLSVDIPEFTFRSCTLHDEDGRELFIYLPYDDQLDVHNGWQDVSVAIPTTPVESLDWTAVSHITFERAGTTDVLPVDHDRLIFRVKDIEIELEADVECPSADIINNTLSIDVSTEISGAKVVLALPSLVDLEFLMEFDDFGVGTPTPQSWVLGHIRGNVLPTSLRFFSSSDESAESGATLLIPPTQRPVRPVPSPSWELVRLDLHSRSVVPVTLTAWDSIDRLEVEYDSADAAAAETLELRGFHVVHEGSSCPSAAGRPLRNVDVFKSRNFGEALVLTPQLDSTEMLIAGHESTGIETIEFRNLDLLRHYDADCNCLQGVLTIEFSVEAATMRLATISFVDGVDAGTAVPIPIDPTKLRVGENEINTVHVPLQPYMSHNFPTADTFGLISRVLFHRSGADVGVESRMLSRAWIHSIELASDSYECEDSLDAILGDDMPETFVLQHHPQEMRAAAQGGVSLGPPDAPFLPEQPDSRADGFIRTGTDSVSFIDGVSLYSGTHAALVGRYEGSVSLAGVDIGHAEYDSGFVVVVETTRGYPSWVKPLAEHISEPASGLIVDALGVTSLHGHVSGEDTVVVACRLSADERTDVIAVNGDTVPPGGIVTDFSMGLSASTGSLQFIRGVKTEPTDLVLSVAASLQEVHMLVESHEGQYYIESDNVVSQEWRSTTLTCANGGTLGSSSVTASDGILVVSVSLDACAVDVHVGSAVVTTAAVSGAGVLGIALDSHTVQWLSTITAAQTSSSAVAAFPTSGIFVSSFNDAPSDAVAASSNDESQVDTELAGHGAHSTNRVSIIMASIVDGAIASSLSVTSSVALPVCHAVQESSDAVQLVCSCSGDCHVIAANHTSDDDADHLVSDGQVGFVAYIDLSSLEIDLHSFAVADDAAVDVVGALHSAQFGGRTNAASFFGSSTGGISFAAGSPSDVSVRGGSVGSTGAFFVHHEVRTSESLADVRHLQQPRAVRGFAPAEPQHIVRFVAGSVVTVGDAEVDGVNCSTVSLFNEQLQVESQHSLCGPVWISIDYVAQTLTPAGSILLGGSLTSLEQDPDEIEFANYIQSNTNVQSVLNVRPLNRAAEYPVTLSMTPGGVLETLSFSPSRMNTTASVVAVESEGGFQGVASLVTANTSGVWAYSRAQKDVLVNTSRSGEPLVMLSLLHDEDGRLTPLTSVGIRVDGDCHISVPTAAFDAGPRAFAIHVALVRSGAEPCTVVAGNRSGGFAGYDEHEIVLEHTQHSSIVLLYDVPTLKLLWHLAAPSKAFMSFAGGAVAVGHGANVSVIEVTSGHKVWWAHPCDARERDCEVLGVAPSSDSVAVLSRVLGDATCGDDCLQLTLHNLATGGLSFHAPLQLPRVRRKTPISLVDLYVSADAVAGVHALIEAEGAAGTAHAAYAVRIGGGSAHGVIDPPSRLVADGHTVGAVRAVSLGVSLVCAAGSFKGDLWFESAAAGGDYATVDDHTNAFIHCSVVDGDAITRTIGRSDNVAHSSVLAADATVDGDLHTIGGFAVAVDPDADTTVLGHPIDLGSDQGAFVASLEDVTGAVEAVHSPWYSSGSSSVRAIDTVASAAFVAGVTEGAPYASGAPIIDDDALFGSRQFSGVVVRVLPRSLAHVAGMALLGDDDADSWVAPTAVSVDITERTVILAGTFSGTSVMTSLGAYADTDVSGVHGFIGVFDSLSFTANWLVVLRSSQGSMYLSSASLFANGVSLAVALQPSTCEQVVVESQDTSSVADVACDSGMESSTIVMALNASDGAATWTLPIESTNSVRGRRMSAGPKDSVAWGVEYTGDLGVSGPHTADGRGLRLRSSRKFSHSAVLQISQAGKLVAHHMIGDGDGAAVSLHEAQWDARRHQLIVAGAYAGRFSIRDSGKWTVMAENSDGVLSAPFVTAMKISSEVKLHRSDLIATARASPADGNSACERLSHGATSVVCSSTVTNGAVVDLEGSFPASRAGSSNTIIRVLGAHPFTTRTAHTVVTSELGAPVAVSSAAAVSDGSLHIVLINVDGSEVHAFDEDLNLPGGGDGMIAALDDNDGSVVWKHTFGDPVTAESLDAVSEVGDLLVVFGSTTGTPSFALQSLANHGAVLVSPPRVCTVFTYSSDGTEVTGRLFGSQESADECHVTAAAHIPGSSEVYIGGMFRGTELPFEYGVLVEQADVLDGMLSAFIAKYDVFTEEFTWTSIALHSGYMAPLDVESPLSSIADLSVSPDSKNVVVALNFQGGVVELDRVSVASPAPRTADSEFAQKSCTALLMPTSHLVGPAPIGLFGARPISGSDYVACSSTVFTAVDIAVTVNAHGTGDLIDSGGAFGAAASRAVFPTKDEFGAIVKFSARTLERSYHFFSDVSGSTVGALARQPSQAGWLASAVTASDGALSSAPYPGDAAAHAASTLVWSDKLAQLSSFPLSNKNLRPIASEYTGLVSEYTMHAEIWSEDASLTTVSGTIASDEGVGFRFRFDVSSSDTQDQWTSVTARITEAHGIAPIGSILLTMWESMDIVELEHEGASPDSSVWIRNIRLLRDSATCSRCGAFQLVEGTASGTLSTSAEDAGSATLLDEPTNLTPIVSPTSNYPLDGWISLEVQLPQGCSVDSLSVGNHGETTLLPCETSGSTVTAQFSRDPSEQSLIDWSRVTVLQLHTSDAGCASAAVEADDLFAGKTCHEEGGFYLADPTAQGTSQRNAREGLDLTHGGRYKVISRGLNVWGDYSFPTCSASFVVDITPPDVDSASVVDRSLEIGADLNDIQYTRSSAIAVGWVGDVFDLESAPDGFLDISITALVHPDGIFEALTPAYQRLPGLADDTIEGPEVVMFDGATYAIELSFRNRARLVSSVLSNGVTYDATAPHVYNLTFLANDGIRSPSAIGNSTHLKAVWEAFDPHTFVGRLMVGIGTSEDGPDAVGFADLPNTTTCATFVAPADIGFAFSSGQEYYVIVRVFNPAGAFRDVVSSKAYVDVTPPYLMWLEDISEIVHDGDAYEADDATGDVDLHSSTGIVRAKYRCGDDESVGDDSERGSMEYSFRVCVDDACATAITELNSTGTTQRGTSVRLDSLSEGLPVAATRLYVQVACTNPAGLTSYFMSDGMDIGQPPSVGSAFVHDVAVAGDLTGENADDMEFTDGEAVAVEWGGIGGNADDPAIITYLVSLGQFPGSGDTVDAVDVGGEVTQYTYTGDLLDNVTYYFTVDALTLGGNSTVTSDGFLVDFSPPVLINVSDVGFDEDTSVLPGYGDEDFHYSASHIGVRFTVYDYGSSVESCQWGVGPCGGAQFGTVALRSADPDAGFEWIDGLAMSQEVTVCTTVRCTNGAGLTSEVISDGITYDGRQPHVVSVDVGRADVHPGFLSAPVAPVYYTCAFDVSWATPPTAAHVWIEPVDRPDLRTDDVVAAEPPAIVDFSELAASLDATTAYVAMVQCTTGRRLSEEATSRDFVVDSTAPTNTSAHVGLAPPTAFSDDDAYTVSAMWGGFADAESRIEGFSWAIGTRPFTYDVMPLTNVGAVTKATSSPLEVDDGEVVYITVVAHAWSGLSVRASSQGIVIDGSAVTVQSTTVGRPYGMTNYLVGPELRLAWREAAPRASTVTASVALGYSPYGEQLSVLTEQTQVLENSEYSVSLEVNTTRLAVGTPFYVTLVLVNERGGTTVWVSPPVIYDAESPAIHGVSDGVVLFHDESAMNVTTSVPCSWRASDRGSSIANTTICVKEQSSGDTWACTNNFTGSLRHSTATLRSASPVVHGRAYVCVVTVDDEAGWPTTAASTGFVADNTAPTAGTISYVHSTMYPGTEIVAQSHTDLVSISWSTDLNEPHAFGDAESDIVAMHWQLFSHTGALVAQQAVPYARGSAEMTHLSLVTNGTYSSVISLTNAAGLQSVAPPVDIAIVELEAAVVVTAKAMQLFAEPDDDQIGCTCQDATAVMTQDGVCSCPAGHFVGVRGTCVPCPDACDSEQSAICDVCEAQPEAGTPPAEVAFGDTCDSQLVRVDGECVCRPGEFWVPDSCSRCPAGTHKKQLGNSSSLCMACEQDPTVLVHVSWRVPVEATYTAYISAFDILVGTGQGGVRELVERVPVSTASHALRLDASWLAHLATVAVTVQPVVAGQHVPSGTQSIFVDWSPPAMGQVWDGASSIDLDLVSPGTEASLSWQSFQDSESGILGYLVSVTGDAGNPAPEWHMLRDTTSVCGDIFDQFADARGLTVLEDQQVARRYGATFTAELSLDMSAGEAFTSRVRAVNCAGQLSSTAVSNGFRVARPIEEGFVAVMVHSRNAVDRSEWPDADIPIPEHHLVQHDTSSVSAVWWFGLRPTDPGTLRYEWAIEMWNVTCDCPSVLQNWTEAGSAGGATALFEPGVVHDGMQFRVMVTASDITGAVATAVSPYTVVDTSAPVVHNVTLVSPEGRGDYSRETSALTVRWAATDSTLGSGINALQLSIGSIRGGEQAVARTTVGADLTGEVTFQGLNLSSGLCYTAALSATDAGGLVSPSSFSEPLCVDTSPPAIHSLQVAGSEAVSGNVSALAVESHGPGGALVVDTLSTAFESLVVTGVAEDDESEVEACVANLTDYGTGNGVVQLDVPVRVDGVFSISVLDLVDECAACAGSVPIVQLAYSCTNAAGLSATRRSAAFILHDSYPVVGDATALDVPTFVRPRVPFTVSWVGAFDDVGGAGDLMSRVVVSNMTQHEWFVGANLTELWAGSRFVSVTSSVGGLDAFASVGNVAEVAAGHRGGIDVSIDGEVEGNVTVAVEACNAHGRCTVASQLSYVVGDSPLRGSLCLVNGDAGCLEDEPVVIASVHDLDQYSLCWEYVHNSSTSVAAQVASIGTVDGGQQAGSIDLEPCDGASCCVAVSSVLASDDDGFVLSHDSPLFGHVLVHDKAGGSGVVSAQIAVADRQAPFQVSGAAPSVRYLIGDAEAAMVPQGASFDGDTLPPSRGYTVAQGDGSELSVGWDPVPAETIEEEGIHSMKVRFVDVASNAVLAEVSVDDIKSSELSTAVVPAVPHNTRVQAFLGVADSLGNEYWQAAAAELVVDSTPPAAVTEAGGVFLRDGTTPTHDRDCVSQSGVEPTGDRAVLVSRSAALLVATNPGDVPHTFDDAADAGLHQDNYTLVSANWGPWVDAESGIARVEVALGSSADGATTDILGFTALDGTPSTVDIAVPALPVGSSVFLSVRATNAAGLSAVATSDGMRIVCAPSAPSCPFDGYFLCL